jgi:hypothetical protein
MNSVTTSEAARMLGLANAHGARRALHRLDVHPVARQPGRSGESLYDADEIRTAMAKRLGRGARTDLKRSPT